MDANGISTHLPVIRQVGIFDLAEVKSYYINTVGTSTSHVVCFHGGGYLRYAYSQAGELIELSGRSVRSYEDREGNCMFGAYQGIPTDMDDSTQEQPKCPKSFE